MRKIYELGHNREGKFYIAGVLKEDGTLDSKDWIDTDSYEGMTHFKGEEVTPEYLGQVQITDNLKPPMNFRKLIGRAIRFSNRREINSNKEDVIRIPERTNAYHRDITSVVLNLPPEWKRIDDPHLTLNSIAFLRIEDKNL